MEMVSIFWKAREKESMGWIIFKSLKKNCEFTCLKMLRIIETQNHTIVWARRDL